MGKYFREIQVPRFQRFPDSRGPDSRGFTVVCESKILDGVVYFNPNPHNIILIEDRTIHNFCSRSGSWNCDSCLAKCKKRIRLPHILSKIGESSSTETMFTEIEYKTISTLNIPLILDEILISNYNTQLYQGTWLPSKSGNSQGL